MLTSFSSQTTNRPDRGCRSINTVMSLPFDRLLAIHQTLWRYCGAWFTNDSHPWLYTIYSLFLHVVHLLFCASLWFYMQNARDMMEANDLLTVGSIFTLVSVKSILFVRRQAKCIEILATIRRLEQAVQPMSDVEQAIVQKTVYEMLFIGKFIGVCAFSAAFIHVFMTQVLSRERLLIFPAALPYDWMQSNALLHGTNVFQMFCALYSSAILATLDIIGPHLYMMLNAFVRVLGHRMATIGWDQEISGKIDDVATTRQILNCILFHEQCLR